MFNVSRIRLYDTIRSLANNLATNTILNGKLQSETPKEHAKDLDTEFGLRVD